jgi:hypothetical protein
MRAILIPDLVLQIVEVSRISEQLITSRTMPTSTKTTTTSLVIEPMVGQNVVVGVSVAEAATTLFPTASSTLSMHSPTVKGPNHQMDSRFDQIQVHTALHFSNRPTAIHMHKLLQEVVVAALDRNQSQTTPCILASLPTAIQARNK